MYSEPKKKFDQIVQQLYRIVLQLYRIVQQLYQEDNNCAQNKRKTTINKNCTRDDIQLLDNITEWNTTLAPTKTRIQHMYNKCINLICILLLSLFLLISPFVSPYTSTPLSLVIIILNQGDFKSALRIWLAPALLPQTAPALSLCILSP